MENNIIQFPQKDTKKPLHDKTNALINEILDVNSAVGCILWVINEKDQGKKSFETNTFVAGREDIYYKLAAHVEKIMRNE
jgi:hypothetical protein